MKPIWWGGQGPGGAYLDIEGIVEMAKERGVNYIHPGYGFLAENADFAEACPRLGLPLWGHARNCCARWVTRPRHAR